MNINIQCIVKQNVAERVCLQNVIVRTLQKTLFIIRHNLIAVFVKHDSILLVIKLLSPRRESSVMTPRLKQV